MAMTQEPQPNAEMARNVNTGNPSAAIFMIGQLAPQMSVSAARNSKPWTGRRLACPGTLSAGLSAKT